MLPRGISDVRIHDLSACLQTFAPALGVWEKRRRRRQASPLLSKRCSRPRHCVCVFIGTKDAYMSYRAMLSQTLEQADDVAPEYKTQADALLSSDPVNMLGQPPTPPNISRTITNRCITTCRPLRPLPSSSVSTVPGSRWVFRQIKNGIHSQSAQGAKNRSSLRSRSRKLEKAVAGNRGAPDSFAAAKSNA